MTRVFHYTNLFHLPVGVRLCRQPYVQEESREEWDGGLGNQTRRHPQNQTATQSERERERERGQETAREREDRRQRERERERELKEGKDN